MAWIFLLGFLIVGLLVALPLINQVYSPFASVFDDIMDAPLMGPWEQEQGAPRIPTYKIKGQILFANGSAVQSVEVRIFATDELTSEYVLTDLLGYFYSQQGYSDGQVLAITVLEQRISVFLPYTISDYDEYVDVGTLTLDL